jgi:hypothetical protein
MEPAPGGRIFRGVAKLRRAPQFGAGLPAPLPIRGQGVPASTASFMYQQGRTWSFSARKTARLSNAFALGLGDRRALATMKHFPGLGFATRNTDDYVVRIIATRSQLARGLKPYGGRSRITFR